MYAHQEHERITFLSLILHFPSPDTPTAVSAQPQVLDGIADGVAAGMTLSFYDRALAVKRVAENQGERTSGVDGKLWGTTATKYKAIGTCTRQTFFIAPAIHSSL
jgi:hypothetical protein